MQILTGEKDVQAKNLTIFTIMSLFSHYMHYIDTCLHIYIFSFALKKERNLFLPEIIFSIGRGIFGFAIDQSLNLGLASKIKY